MTLRAGELRERVVIASPSTAAGPVTLTTLATVWAAIRPLRADEAVAAGATVSLGDYMVEIQYRTDVTPRHQLSWTPYGGSAKTLRIVGVQQSPGRPDRTLLTCGEVL